MLQKRSQGTIGKFEGDMNNFETPILPQVFFKWVLLGHRSG